MSEVHIAPVRLYVTHLEVGEDVRALVAHCFQHGDATILGHAFDGVLWGLVCSGRVVTPEGGALLRAGTLLDLRVFNEARELRVWRGESALLACEVRESSEGGLELAAFQERDYLLLSGPKKAAIEGDFARLEGRAGQTHTPPLIEGRAPAKIRVRHYLRQNEQGMLQMAEHRILSLRGDV